MKGFLQRVPLLIPLSIIVYFMYTLLIPENFYSISRDILIRLTIYLDSSSHEEYYELDSTNGDNSSVNFNKVEYLYGKDSPFLYYSDNFQEIEYYDSLASKEGLNTPIKFNQYIYYFRENNDDVFYKISPLTNQVLEISVNDLCSDDILESLTMFPVNTLQVLCILDNFPGLHEFVSEIVSAHTFTFYGFYPVNGRLFFKCDDYTSKTFYLYEYFPRDMKLKLLTSIEVGDYFISDIIGTR